MLLSNTRTNHICRGSNQGAITWGRGELDLYEAIKYIFIILNLPPKQAPKANAQTSGCSGRFKALFCANEMVIFTIMVVNGILSTKADAIAETLRRKRYMEVL